MKAMCTYPEIANIFLTFLSLITSRYVSVPNSDLNNLYVRSLHDQTLKTFPKMIYNILSISV